MGNKLVTYTAYFNHQHLFLLSMATKTVTPSSAEGALIWTSKFSDFLIIINPNSKNSFCVHERSCSHNIRVNQILWRIHFQRSISLDSRSSRAGIRNSQKWLQDNGKGTLLITTCKRIICKPNSLTMSLKSSQDTTKEGQYFPERVKFRVSDS